MTTYSNSTAVSAPTSAATGAFLTVFNDVTAAVRRRLSRVALGTAFTCAALATLSALIPASAQAAPIDSLIKSVKFDDIDGVNKLLAKGMDPNSVDDQGIPLLVLAAREKS